MNRATEVALLARIEAGDKAAEWELLEALTPLLKRLTYARQDGDSVLVGSNRGGGISVREQYGLLSRDDAMQIAQLAVIEALRSGRYMAERGRFTAFAWLHAHHAVLAAIRAEAKLAERVTLCSDNGEWRNLEDASARLRVSLGAVEAAARYYGAEGFEVQTEEEVAEAMGLDRREVSGLIDVVHAKLGERSGVVAYGNWQSGRPLSGKSKGGA